MPMRRLCRVFLLMMLFFYCVLCFSTTAAWSGAPGGAVAHGRRFAALERMYGEVVSLLLQPRRREGRFFFARLVVSRCFCSIAPDDVASALTRCGKKTCCKQRKRERCCFGGSTPRGAGLCTGREHWSVVSFVCPSDWTDSKLHL